MHREILNFRLENLEVGTVTEQMCWGCICALMHGGFLEMLAGFTHPGGLGLWAGPAHVCMRFGPHM